jgi:small subunit ribosomal protein S17
MSKTEKKVRNIGIPSIKPPEKVCKDHDCPFHGKLRVRGKLMEGVVTSTKMRKAATFQMDYLSLVKKYGRYERRRSRKHAHVPDCLNVQVGDIVKVIECKPISKNISTVVVDVARPQIPEVV